MISARENILSQSVRTTKEIEPSPPSSPPSSVDWNSRSTLSRSEPGRTAGFPVSLTAPASSFAAAISSSSFFSHKDNGIGMAFGSSVPTSAHSRPRSTGSNAKSSYSPSDKVQYNNNETNAYQQNINNPHQGSSLFQSTSTDSRMNMRDDKEDRGSVENTVGFMGYPFASSSPICYQPNVTIPSQHPPSASPSPRSRYPLTSSAPPSPMSSFIRSPFIPVSVSSLNTNEEAIPGATTPKVTREDFDWEEDLFYFYQPPELEEAGVATASALVRTNTATTPGPLPIRRASLTPTSSTSLYSQVPSPMTASQPRNITSASTSPFGSLFPSPRTSVSAPSSPFHHPLSNPIACKSGGRNISTYYDSASDEDDFDYPKRDSKTVTGNEIEYPFNSLSNNDIHDNKNSNRQNGRLHNSNANSTKNNNENRTPSDGEYENDSDVPGSDNGKDMKKISPYLLALQSNKGNSSNTEPRKHQLPNSL